MSLPRPAIVLLSGGMDSATCLAIAAAEGYVPYALSFRYGQRHATELDAAARVAGRHGAVEHRIVDLDLRAFGGSALTADVAVPKDRDAAAMARQVAESIPPERRTMAGRGSDMGEIYQPPHARRRGLHGELPRVRPVTRRLRGTFPAYRAARVLAACAGPSIGCSR